MGVPKFYRWISERYPCLSEVVREYQIPEFDNLYLDMNGIIHLCSHPNDDDPHFRITEAQIFSDIFHYIECLFRMIKPKKVFFMAVDGVAPRAKMNQQRGRRFRSAREALDSEKKAVQRGEVLPSEERFDSNCITPGTEFMVRLHEQLKYFVNMKISTDQMWQGPRIYLSGHETPGEGEHKVMDFIRCEKSKRDYDPNTRHCLYGLDADLMMLGLCTHEPHFSLLREEVRFTGKKSQKRTPTPEETTFHLLHLSLMREYLEHEFSPLKQTLKFEFDIEMIINDWVLMGFLVGNDFIPNLPNMHIVHGALPLLYQTYINVLPTLDGYINEDGYLNLVRFEKYMKKLAEHDYEHFNENYTDFKWLDSKRKSSEEANGQIFRGKRLKARIDSEKKKIQHANNFSALNDISDDDFQGSDSNKTDDDVPIGKLIDYDESDEHELEVELLGEEEEDEDEEEEEEEEEDDTFEMEFRQHKRDYYVTKLAYEQVTPAVLRDQAECYVRAIQWNLHYYYNGVCSWSWFYPHHYAPFISDIKNFSHLKLEYDLDTPFLPFEQLLAVLPSASCKLLPEPFQTLMCNSDSPLIDYYPADFETDLNGKQQDWEAVVLIPFINEKRLLEGMKPIYEYLTDEESRRNRHGPCLLYTFTKELQGPYSSPLPLMFPDVEINHAKCTEIPLDGFYVERSQLVKGLCAGIRLDVFFPGFPTLKHILHKSYLKKAEVKVFQMPSRSDNMILEILKRMDMSLEEAAGQLLDEVIYVGWPHLTEALVTSVANLTTKCTPSKSSKQFLKENMHRMDSVDWAMHRDGIKERYFRRWGVDIKETEILVFAKPLIGRKYTCTSNGRVTLEKQWATMTVPYALQTIVKDIAVHDSSFQQYVTLEELFPPKSCVFSLDLSNYGLMGTVEKVQSKPKVSISVRFEVPEEPNLDPIATKQGIAFDDYLPAYIVAQRLAIGSQLLSRITSTFYIKMGSRSRPVNQRANIGLNLKFSKKNIEVPGYTKKNDNDWLYSPKAIEIIGSYISKFPDLFDFLSANFRKEYIYQEELNEVYQEEKILNVIQEFLKSLPSYQCKQQLCGGDQVTEELIKAIEETCEKVSSKPKFVQMEMSANVLYKPNNFRGSATPDRSVTFRLLDRVVNVRDGFTVPLGFRGTVIGIHIDENGSDVVYDILFDKEFNGALSIRGSKSRGYQVPSYALINLTHGIRLEQQQQNHKPMAVVYPQAALLNAGSTTETIASLSVSVTKTARNGRRNVSDTIKANNKPQGRYPNTINHSPNSPFISRQTPATKPQFVTPRLPTTSSRGTTRQSSSSAHQQIHGGGGGGGNVQQRGPDSDFKNIWERLKQVQTLQAQSSAEVEPRTSDMSKGSLTLSQAAKTLPKHNSKQARLRGGFKQADDSGSTQRQRQQPPMPKFKNTSGTRIEEDTEFAAMLQALDKAHNKERANKAQQMETGAAVELAKLLQDMNVNENERNDFGSKSKDVGGSLSKPNSGIRLTVDQLFNETRKHEQKVRETSNKTVPSKTQSDQNVSRSKHRETKKDTSEQSSNNEMYRELLGNLCHQRFGSIPVYEYKRDSSNMMLAIVHLPRGNVCDGGRGKDQQEAAENAAKIAYNQMMKSVDVQGQPLTSGGSSLNPLVTVPLAVSQHVHVRLPAYHVYQQQQQQQQALLQQRMGNPYLLQSPYASRRFLQGGALGYVSHPMLQPYPPQPPAPQPSYLTNPWIQMADPSNSSIDVQLHPRAAPRYAGFGVPFVPLQVTKQNMLPKKPNLDSSVCTEKPTSLTKTQTTTRGGGGDYKNTRSAANPAVREEKNRGKIVTSSIVPLIRGGSDPPGHRRNKSRLAINFGANPQ